jgi:glycosyltransferase involved in cell wall biosynthesis
MSNRRLVVALPVKDEADRLGDCLDALTRQDIAADLTILALVNNSTDESAAIARRFKQVVVEEITLPEAEATAGAARRLAMQMAAEIAGANGILLTTDADGRVTANWLRANLQALHAGADAVAGRALIDPIEEAFIPLALREADARECRYAALLDELAAAIDPDPADPWPRHDEDSGASIAVTVNAFRRAGGVPNLPMGEDRAFIRSLRRIDARVRHAPDVHVVVSGRTEGRAKGGMADTIRRRMVCPDVFLDDRLEGARHAARRARLRRRARALWAEGATDFWAVLALARDLALPSASVREKLAAPWFGTAWDALENASPDLRRSPVPTANVGDEIAHATALLRASASVEVDVDVDVDVDQVSGISA